MKRYLLLIFIATVIFGSFYFAFELKNDTRAPGPRQESKHPIELKPDLKDAITLLKSRRDNAALAIFEKVLSQDPDNLDALWGKAEVLRRKEAYEEAKELLVKVLDSNPSHASSLISLAYLKYENGRLDEASVLLNRAVKNNYLDKETLAMVYILRGCINNKRSTNAGFLRKIKYARQIKKYFQKAGELAPELSEAHLGLGIFYLVAPSILGGNLDKALAELELAVKIAPDFATANAKLAEAYQRKGLLEKYVFFINRAQKLGPVNRALDKK